MAEPFRIVGDDETKQPKTDRLQNAGMQALMLGLGALSQRALAALSSLFTLVTIASAFWLWYVTPEPSPYQLIKLAMYGLLVLAINWVVRRK